VSALDILGPHRVVPVVVLDDAGRAADLGDALRIGGLPVAEVTFRSPGAVGVLGALAARGDLLVGAGTVLTTEQVDRAHDAGAGFVVSPGLSVAVVQRCRELGLPVLPGVCTPGEIMAALDLGLDTVKFFPAEPSGGLGMVDALAAAFPQVRFVPTGGIGPENAADYLAHPAVAAIGGSWMVAPSLISAARWVEVAARSAAAVRLFTPEPQAAVP
jgi:2-dehydro-3-deoxyphosphogluconate aldolase/(4S)-4-hydroxy-2-oxoglutarate aldolase